MRLDASPNWATLGPPSLVDHLDGDEDCLSRCPDSDLRRACSHAEYDRGRGPSGWWRGGRRRSTRIRHRDLAERRGRSRRTEDLRGNTARSTTSLRHPSILPIRCLRDAGLRAAGAERLSPAPRSLEVLAARHRGPAALLRFLLLQVRTLLLPLHYVRAGDWRLHVPGLCVHPHLLFAACAGSCPGPGAVAHTHRYRVPDGVVSTARRWPLDPVRVGLDSEAPISTVGGATDGAARRTAKAAAGAARSGATLDAPQPTLSLDRCAGSGALDRSAGQSPRALSLQGATPGVEEPGHTRTGVCRSETNGVGLILQPGTLRT